jgi:hypothetical protein
MTATDTIASTLLVAIDISKHRHEVLIGVPGKKRRRRLTILNTLEDFQRLSAPLASYDLPVRIGFEATGNYHRPLAHHLGQAGFDLKLISSVGLARSREALHNSWDKNDPRDAQVILHMLEISAARSLGPVAFTRSRSEHLLQRRNVHHLLGQRCSGKTPHWGLF